MAFRIVASALLVASWAVPQPSWGVDCVYRANAPATTVTHDGGRSALGDGWVASHHCEDVAVAAGSVSVRRPRQSGGVDKADVGAGRFLASSKADDGSPVWDELVAIVSGDARQRAGRSRGVEADDALEASLPRGKVGSSDGASLDVTLPARPNGNLFILSEGGRTVWQTRLDASLLAIPARFLLAGHRYRWSYTATERPLAGELSVVDRAAVLDALEQPSDDDDAGDPLWTQAVRLRKAGFEMDARRVMREWLSR